MTQTLTRNGPPIIGAAKVKAYARTYPNGEIVHFTNTGRFFIMPRKIGTEGRYIDGRTARAMVSNGTLQRAPTTGDYLSAETWKVTA